MNSSNESQSRRNVALKVASVIVAFLSLTVSFVCWRLGALPTEVQWWVNDAPGPLVISALDAARYELAGTALIALNFILYIARDAALIGRVGQGLKLKNYKLSTSSDVIAGLGVEQSDRRFVLGNSPAASDVLSDRDIGSDRTVGSLSSSDLASTSGNKSAFVNGEIEQATDVCLPDISLREEPEIGPGRINSQLQIATDEVARLRRELVSLRQQLETANQTKTQFLANMSHELRTPMNGIMGMTDLLLGASLTAREERFVRSIAASSNALLAIINDLLDFSKIESGILQLEHGRFSVRDCVEDVCSLLAGNAHSKNIELICYVDESVPQRMDGDPARVRQILNNLISNAIAFTDQGEVVVRLSRKGGAKGKSILSCDVQDTGVGISPEMQVRLFEAFTQGDMSNTRDHGGLGMGLAIARNLVHMMNGELSFRSRLGEGTRFTFTMELDDVPESDNTSKRRRSLAGARVLVVDDNETNRTIMYHQLSNWGLVVECVSSGYEAIQVLNDAQASEQGFEVLVLDLHMPGMDGIQLAKHIQADPSLRHLQSIMLTSAILQLDGMELRRLGIYKYVSKPARQSVLHDSLASLMPFIGGGNENPPVPVEEEDVVAAKRFSANVLLVEDNLINQDVATGMLEQFGCAVRLATNGQEAVTMADEKSYDLIFMDCQMPILDGYEATRQIKARSRCNKATPIIALTANAMEGDREKCLLAGMDDYVSKPIVSKTVAQVLEVWLSADHEPFDVNTHSMTPALMVSDNDAMATLEIIRSSDSLDNSMREQASVSANDAFSTPAAGKAHTDSTLSEGADPLTESVAEENGTEPVTDSKVDAGIAKPSLPASAGESQSERVSEQSAPEKPDPIRSETVETSETLLNMKAIETIRGLQRPGKEDLLTKVINVFFNRTPEAIESMRKGLEDNDHNSLSAQAHSLKSSSAYLGADCLSAHCKSIELAIADGSFDELNTLVQRIVDDYEKVRVELASLMVASSDEAA